MATKKKNQLNIIGEAVLDDNDKVVSKKAFIQPSKEIAPVKKTDGFLKSSDAADNWSLSTGNPMLDFIQRTNAGIWGTVFNAGTNVVRGATGSIEGVGDFAQNRVADIQDLFGFDEAAEKTRRKSEETWGVNKKIDEFNDIMNTTSILGDKSEGVFQGVGSSLLAMGTAGLGGAVSGGSQLISSIASLGTLGIGAAGSSENEARMQMMNEMKDKGYTTKQINDAARMYGLFSGTAETLSEMMFGGISKASKALGIGKGLFDSADDAVINTLTKNIQGKIVKNLVQAGLKASGEGVEEVASGLMDAFAKKLTYMKDEKLIDLIKDEKLFDSFISGTLSAYITQAPSAFKSVTTRQDGKLRLQTNEEIRDFITNLNQQEQQVVEREIENRIGQEEKVSKKRRIEIEKQVIEDLDRGYINADTIRDVLGENYNAERDVRLNESFNEETRRTQAYENDLSKYDEKQRKTIQTAIDSGLLNNSNKTHDFVDLIAKISADKGVDFDFTNNQRINETGFGIKGKTVNGFVKDGTINLNLESNQALNKTVGHEITHVLEGTEVYQELQNSLRSYLGEKEWNNRIKDLSETYKNVENANIENELTSDLVGDYIFNDESFVRNLSTRNQNLFQKIFDEIKYLVKVATAGSKEARDLEKAKRMFEKAYRETSKTQQGTQYSIKESKKALENQFKELTGDSMLVADAKLGNYAFQQIQGKEVEAPYSKEAMDLYEKIQDSKQTSSHLYHSTPVDRIQSIVQNGLQVGSQQNQEGVSSTDKLYLSATEELADSFTPNDSVTLRISPNANLENLDNDLLGGEGSYTITNNIDPKYLQVKENGKWVNLLKSQYAKQNNQNTRYSLSVQEANTTQDNEGRKLTDNQLAYFKDSKAVDENGNLVTVYHTMTNAGEQFNEFNPVGTEGYRFGDQVVNYYTNSKDMSGSYADSEYEMADTKRVENINEAKDLISSYNAENETSFEIANNPDGTMSIVDNTYANALSRMRTLWENEFSPEEKARLKEYGEQMEGYIRSGYDNSLYPNFGSLDKVLPDISKKIDNIESNLKSYERDIFSSIRMNPDGEIPSYIQTEPVYVGTYNTENEMLRDVKSALRRANSVRANYQYEGYANLKNPYIVDAENRNWNAVETKENEFTNKIKDLSNESKELLKTLSKDSEKVFRQTEDNYLNLDKAIGNIKRNDTLPKDITGMAYVIQDYYSTLNDFLENQYLSSSSSTMMTMLSSLRNNGLITLDEYADYSYDGSKSNELRNKINDIINKEFEFEGSKYTLKELSNDWHNAMVEYYQKYNHEWDYFYEEANKRIKELNDEDYKLLDDLFIEANNGIRKMYLVAKDNFDVNKINSIFGDNYTTNDIVKRVIDMNNNGYNYDGVIIKNTRDYGGEYKGKHTANDLYITFNSNQFKAVDNLNPTDDADIRYQLGNNEVAPTSGWNVRSEDVRLQSAFNDAIAPLQEQVQQLTDTITRLEDRIAPLNEQEADELYQETQRGFENEVAPIRENLTEEENRRMDVLDLLERNNMLTEEQRYEREQLQSKENPVNVDDEVTVGQSLEDIRDINEVGSPKVKSYQYEHPEVKPYFQQEARGMLSDLNNSQKGERFKVTSNVYDGHIIEQDEWKGISRFTSPQIAELLDSKWGYTYKDIEKGLNAIIEDHGAENIAIAKRIEFILDDNLRNGYTDWQTGMEVPPNQDYLNMLKQQEWENYFDDINNQYPLEQNIPQYDLENDFSDVKIEPDIQDMTEDDLNLEPFLNGLQGARERQTERQQLKEEINQKREVKMPKQSDGRRAWNKFKSLFVNEFAVIDDYAKQTGNTNIKFKADTYNNYQAIAQSNIETAQTDINGKAIGRSGNSIFEEAKSLGLEDTFDEYLKQWANVDRAKQGKGAANYSAQESYKIVKEMEAKNPELKRLGKDMWQYYRNARHNLRDAGIISQEVSDMLGRMYPHYTPYISENIENYFTDEGKLKPKATIKRAKGGAAIGSLLSAEEAMQRYTKSEFNTIFGNDLYKEIINTSNDIVQLGGDERGMNYVNADNLYADKDGYYLTAYKNGEPITAKISEDMYRTLSRESRNRISDIENTFRPVGKVLSTLSNIRRNILTSWSPTFIAKNFIKDYQEALFNSKYTADFVKNYPTSFKELATNTGEAQQFKALYGSGLTMGQFDVDSETYNPSAKNKNFLKGVKNANELIELAPRYAEFKASRQNGCSLEESMYNAREVTTNFSRGGVITKAFNKYGMTFLNSSVQGFDKFIRNFSGENGAKGIVNSLAKAAIFGIAPAVFNELAFGSGDDKDEEYEALPDYIKDNYYIIKTGNGNFIRIPKGRVFSVFGSAARRTIEAMEGEENAFEGFLENAQQQIGINNPEENNIFAPLLQAMGGRKLDSGQTAGSAWYGGDIIPSRLQKERPEDQYDASIDNLSIWLGQHTGISPYKINYVLDQYTGGIGDILLPTITPEANSDGSLIAPIKDQFTADTVTDNKYVSEFYDTKGKLYTGSKATDEDILKNKYMSSISTEMAKLYAERREVQASDLSKKEKYAKSQEIKAEINRLAKEGMDNYNNVIMSNNYAKIGDTEYYKNANGQWTKVTDDVASLGLDTEEKNEYYKVKNDIYTTKKENDGNDKPLVMQDIINSNLTPDAKVNLYTSNYKDDLIQPLVDSGMDVDSYLTYKSQNFTADKDSNGKSISGSKKRKVFDYINSMNIPYEQKLILAKSEYNTFNDNNYEILEYINNSPMTYDEKMTLISNLGFKVDGNNVSW